MTDTARAVELSGAIERALTRRGAIGGGLKSRARCFQQYLPRDVWVALDRISKQRNAIAHGETKYLDNLDAYERDCQLVLAAIQAIPAHAKPRASLGRRLLGAPSKFGSTFRHKGAMPAGQAASPFNSHPQSPRPTAPVAPPRPPTVAPRAAPAPAAAASARAPAPRSRRIGFRGFAGWTSVLVIMTCLGILRARHERGAAPRTAQLLAPTSPAQLADSRRPTSASQAPAMPTAPTTRRPAKPAAPKSVVRATPAVKRLESIAAASSRSGAVGDVEAQSAAPHVDGSPRPAESAADNGSQPPPKQPGQLDLTLRALDDF